MAVEAAGLGIGVAGLASLFNTAVQWFEYVQIGKDFGIDFQSAQLELDICRLRVLRWGDAVGLTATSTEARALPAGVSGSEEDIRLAERTLGQINTLFEMIDDASKKYISTLTAIAVYDPDRDLDQKYMNLRQFMQNAAVKRQKTMSFRKKFQWAIHGKSNLDKLLADVKSLTDALTTTFKATKPQQQLFAEMELEEVKDDNLPQLEAASRDRDPILNEAVRNAIETRASYQNRKFEVLDGAKALAGHSVANGYAGPSLVVDYTFEDWKASGQGTIVQCGTRYGGKDIFE
ncbi:Heterokaryon incompatibility protein s [Lasiodiplodia theobromae]|uniref:Heterokaryon incompatibility protein s n=1 Tax=Lasiodiplodia theobromae TaxID=45133 RepID=A0A5N5D036_9PEZI|nr:Heterokaryon incompatibility protein s [Lasiodiplodia theobromae]